MISTLDKQYPEPAKHGFSICGRNKVGPSSNLVNSCNPQTMMLYIFIFTNKNMHLNYDWDTDRSKVLEWIRARINSHRKVGTTSAFSWPRGNELSGLPNPLKLSLEPRRITPLHRKVVILKGPNLERWRAWYLMHACKFMNVLHPLFNPIGTLQGQRHWPIEQLKKLKSSSIKWFAQVQKTP